MCFALPGKIIKVDGAWAEVDFLGQKKRISMEYVHAKAGDYIIAAGNVAADVIPADKAEALIAAFNKSKESIKHVKG